MGVWSCFLHKTKIGKDGGQVAGLNLPGVELSQLAKRLKQKCGSGGTLQDGVIENQGDHRALIADELKCLGFQVKLSGG